MHKTSCQDVEVSNKAAERTYREHVITLGVWLFSFFFLHVELTEEVERKHSVQVDDDARKHERQDQLQQQQSKM